MQYRDTCNRCLTADSPAIPPIDIRPNGPGSILAIYRCPTCRNTWTCGWSAETEDAA